jgi:hypothetical protein
MDRTYVVETPLLIHVSPSLPSGNSITSTVLDTQGMVYGERLEPSFRKEIGKA